MRWLERELQHEITEASGGKQGEMVYRLWGRVQGEAVTLWG